MHLDERRKDAKTVSIMENCMGKCNETVLPQIILLAMFNDYEKREERKKKHNNSDVG